MLGRRVLGSTLLAGSLLALCPAARGQVIVPRPALGATEERAQRVLDLLGPEHLLREAWRVTRARIYAGAPRDLDWEALLERHLPEAQQARTPEQVYALVNRMLGELGLSHLALLGHGVWERELANEFSGARTRRAGCELVRLEGRYFVDGVAEGGPADEAGLREGDEVLALDGRAPAESPLLEGAGHDPGLPGPPGFVLRVAERARIALQVRREAEGQPVPVELRPRPDSLIEATRRSVRVVEVEGQRVGVIHLWHFMSLEMARILRRALRGPLAEADALVLDIRGRGGSTQVIQAVLRLFRGWRRVWRKPVVCLVDGGTRSAKEIFAYHWKRAELGPLIGERTQGACIACRFFQLSDGSVLMVPVSDVSRLTRGVDLEGRGVEPTEAVPDAPLPYRAGRDPILAAGLSRAAALARPPVRSY